MSDSADRRRERDCAGQPVARLRVAVGVWVRRVGVSHTSQEYCELISTLERGGVVGGRGSEKKESGKAVCWRMRMKSEPVEKAGCCGLAVKLGGGAEV